MKIMQKRNNRIICFSFVLLMVALQMSCKNSRKGDCGNNFYPRNTYEKIIVKKLKDTLIIDVCPDGKQWLFVKRNKGYYLINSGRNELFMSVHGSGSKDYPKLSNEPYSHRIRISNRIDYFTSEYLLINSNKEEVPVFMVEYDEEFNIRNISTGAHYISYEPERQ